MARKKKRRARPERAPHLPPWAEEIYQQNDLKSLSADDRHERWQRFDTCGGALIDVHDIERLRSFVPNFEEDLAREIEWYGDKLQDEDEAVAFWHCHLIRENLLKCTLNDVFKTLLKKELFDWQSVVAKRQEPDERDRLLFEMSVLGLFALTSTDIIYEHSAYFRELFKLLRTPEHGTPESDRAMSTFNRYQELDVQTPYLQWVAANSTGENPDPTYQTDEIHFRLIGLIAGIERERLSVSLFREDELQRLDDALTIAAEGANHGPLLLFWNAARDLLFQLSESQRWEQIRASINIAATNYMVSERREFRIWAPHLREWALSLDNFHRGEHPALKSALMLELRQFKSRKESG